MPVGAQVTHHAGVRRVGAVVQAEALAAAVAPKGQEVYLPAPRGRTVLANAQEVCRIV